MRAHPIYPELYMGTVTEYIDKPCTVNGVALWQACYVCGQSITFSRDGGKWQGIGAGLIRHKLCEPPPITGGNL